MSGLIEDRYRFCERGVINVKLLWSVRMGRFAPFSLLAATLLLNGSYSSAQSTPSPRDLSGSWERGDDVGGGSYNGIFDKIIPKAALKPEFVEANRRQEASQNAGQVVSFGSKWCQTFRYPFSMQHCAAWRIVQTDDELIQLPELHTFSRHIYLDGRRHPDDHLLVPSVNGHSVGRWEGNSLVVDTIGFTPGGATPGGGHIGNATRLTEKFELLDGGKLKVTFTWEDPSIYLKPHAYDLAYYRWSVSKPVYSLPLRAVPTLCVSALRKATKPMSSWDQRRMSG